MTKQLTPLNIAVLTVSDTRTEETDKSGAILVERVEKTGHMNIYKQIVADDVYQMRAIVSQWIADSNVHVVLLTGGTGFSHRDSTPEAMKPLFDKEIEGFGELFRQVSEQQIGTSTIQSRALGGLVNSTAIFCLPGSTNACRTAWDKIIAEQLDSRHRPCNFAAYLVGE